MLVKTVAAIKVSTNEPRYPINYAVIPSTDVAVHIPLSRITRSTTKANRIKTTESKIDSKKVDQLKNVKKYSAAVKDQMAENKRQCQMFCKAFVDQKSGYTCLDYLQ